MAKRRWPLLLLLLLAGTGVGLGLAELGARVGGLDPLVRSQALLGHRANRGACMRPAPHMGFELVPNACGTNSLGLVDVEAPVTKAPGTLRVLVLGDSIAEQRTWVDLLEEQLDERSPARVEVWNLGVSGYGTLNELALLRHRALDWDPDLVLLQFCVNDYTFTPVLIRHDGELYKLAAQVEAMGATALWLFERSVLFRAVVLRAVQPQAKMGRDPAHMDRVDAALGEMLALCEAAGVPFGVLVFPELASPADRDRQRTQAYERVLAATTRQAIPTLDLGTAMGPGDLDELTQPRTDELFADLEGALTRWDQDPRVAERLRSLPPSALNLAFRHDPNMPPDRIHPNFLGHWLAAHAAASWALPKLGEGEGREE